MKYLLFFVFALICNIANSQNLTVEYITKKIPTQKALDNMDSASPTIKDLRLQRYKRFFSYTLEQVGSFSLFEESIASKQYNQGEGNMEGTRESDIHYKNFTENEIQVDIKAILKRYKVKDKLHQFEWSLEEGEEYILGYKCNKAIVYDCVLDQKYDVWYSIEIPVSNGPFEFGGLPGLILKMETNGEVVTANAIHFYNEECSVIKSLNVDKGISFLEFCEKRKEEFEKMMGKASF